MITISGDGYTSLFPETGLAIGEAAARLVPRARTNFENIAPAPVRRTAPDDESEAE
ncbi:hypothetical protein ACIPQJ_17495 [Streptomyces sp. NPDC090082]|uniref:hypothetical protein n=1 Tax=unclassified Streptomyces TaxID=2593676 RepID=UPI00382719A6